MTWLRNRWQELIGAFMLLTRLPVGRFSRRAVRPGDCVWAYPLVGAVVGAIGGAAFGVLWLAGLPPAIDAIGGLGAGMLATGALHEDGLADTADGMGGGRSIPQKLAIMRDSRIGSFGALALMLSVAVRGVSLTMLEAPGAVAGALVCAGVAGRGAVLVLLLLLRPAREDGLAAPLGEAKPDRVVCGLIIAVAAALLPFGRQSIASACVAALAFAIVARRQIGGYTGDVLGAAEQLAECAALSACLSRYG
jgi:adenosylcobinamide-GDP ribazoletransferase